VPDALELCSDLGSVYTGGDCIELTQTSGLKRTFASVGRLTGNAVAERVIRTMRVDMIWTCDWKSIDELRKAVDAWRLVYKPQTTASGPQQAAPEERRCANLGTPLTEVV
jgi:transposase InsO family protein